VAIAAALCARLGISHVVLAQRRDRIRTEREKNRRTHFCTEEHAQFVALADHLGSVTRETYDGIAGDVLSQSAYLNPDIQRLFEQRHISAIADYLLDGYGTSVSEHALARWLSPASLREVPRERAIARLTTEIARHLDAPNPAASFFFWNRTRREVALSPFGLMRGIRVHAPYLDDEVYALLSAMPAALQMDHQLHTDAIRRAYPGVSDIPYESHAHRQHRPGFHRRVAIELGRLLAGAPGGLFSRRVWAQVFMTAADGSADRLWFASLTVYLAQLAAVAARAR
jgi:asparagine synthase (glutamine-hydrolysing)